MLEFYCLNGWFLIAWPSDAGMLNGVIGNTCSQLGGEVLPDRSGEPCSSAIGTIANPHLLPEVNPQSAKRVGFCLFYATYRIRLLTARSISSSPRPLSTAFSAQRLNPTA